jgi:hypothetical protein
MQKQDYESFLGRVLLVPGHKALFGHPIDQPDLVAIIRKYNIVEWLSYLARIGGTISCSSASDPDRQLDVVGRTMDQSTADALARFEAEVQTRHPTKVLACNSIQIQAVIQLAILYAPERSDVTLARSGGGAPDLWRAVTGVWDLLNPNDTEVIRDIADNLPVMIRNYLCGPSEEAFHLVARAFYLYQCDREEKSETSKRVDQKFLRVTGRHYESFLLGSVTPIVIEKMMDQTERAEGWKPILCPDGIDEAKLVYREAMDAFVELRSATIPELRKEIEAVEDVNAPLPNWTMLALRKFPIVELSSGARYVLNYEALGEAVLSGPRHELVKNCKHDKGCITEVGGELGILFEEYVDEYLRAAFGDNLIKVPRDVKEKRADYVVSYESHVVVLEVKSGQFRADFRTLQTLDEFKAALKPIVGGAIEQIKVTVESLQEYRLLKDVIGLRDWATTVVIPIVVTFEKLPLIPDKGLVFDALEEPLSRLSGIGHVVPVRYLHVSDVEMLPEVVNRTDFPRLMAKWARDSRTADESFKTFTSHESDRWKVAYFNNRCREFGTQVSSRLELSE